MKHTFAAVVSLLVFTTLIAVKIQLTSAEEECTLYNCGAGEFLDGGIDSSRTCNSPEACWWNSCDQWKGGCPAGGYARHCSQIGPIGCPNTPCVGNGGNCSGDPDVCCNNNCMDGMCGGTCPLMINLKDNSSNYQLTSYDEGVLFDINDAGAPRQVGWTEADSLVGILALDRNGNGTIDDGSELFGIATRKLDGRRALNGFDALADLDSNGDGKIDAQDSEYTLLRVWLDRNHDGVSQLNELLTLGDTGISAFFTTYEETPRIDRHGNLYKYEGSALVIKNGQEHKHKLFDVILITPASIQ